MKVSVDKGLCQGHGMCFMAAPEVFEADEEGYSEVKVTEVPASLQQKVRQAERMCPEYAITIVAADQAANSQEE